MKFIIKENKLEGYVYDYLNDIKFIRQDSVTGFRLAYRLDDFSTTFSAIHVYFIRGTNCYIDKTLLDELSTVFPLPKSTVLKYIVKWVENKYNVKVDQVFSDSDEV